MTIVSSKSSIPDRLTALREHMRAKAIDACIVPTGDPHMSEYTSNHYKTLEFITGFTGSAGTAVITSDAAGLWTDNRYFLQAADQLSGSGITLYKEGMPGTIKIHEFLLQKLQLNSTICVDGRLVSNAWMNKLRRDVAAGNYNLCADIDPVGEIWTDRPEAEYNIVVNYPLQYAGMTRVEKIKIIREDLSAAGTNALVLSMLSDIAWLTNLRGGDVLCNPVFFSFVILTEETVLLYAEPDAFSPELVQELARDGIQLFPYKRFYYDLEKIKEITPVNSPAAVMLDRETCSELIFRSLPEDVRVVNEYSPVMRRKAIKNPVEMDGIRSAHLKDGIAMCRFLYWLKGVAAKAAETCSKMEITELSAAEKLHEFRAEQELFMGDSFEAIVGYGSHGAVVHYSATPESNVALEPHGMVLIDSGGQYLDGTTDITRTIVLGSLCEKEKTLFTAVLRGHINLARAVFPKGLSGANLDYLAHEPLWQMGLDYLHTTGHGVGHYLNVHEDPNEIYWDETDMIPPMPPFEEGMLSSDEPGYYEDDHFGIRHESLLLCIAGDTTAYGQFLKFEEVTLAPFDLEGIIPEQMQPDEINYLNTYHETVYSLIAPHLNEEERTWLREATRKI
ncbi:MAG: aminopeptidase P family protein [Bacillota bacterium]|nr:aminopeptidase P family protein [Bacillota bacterium]